MKKQSTGRNTGDLRYIGDLAMELATMARENGRRDLAAILAMAALEAKGSSETPRNDERV